MPALPLMSVEWLGGSEPPQHALCNCLIALSHQIACHCRIAFSHQNGCNCPIAFSYKKWLQLPYCLLTPKWLQLPYCILTPKWPLGGCLGRPLVVLVPQGCAGPLHHVSAARCQSRWTDPSEYLLDLRVCQVRASEAKNGIASRPQWPRPGLVLVASDS